MLITHPSELLQSDLQPRGNKTIKVCYLLFLVRPSCKSSIIPPVLGSTSLGFRVSFPGCPSFSCSLLISFCFTSFDHTHQAACPFVCRNFHSLRISEPDTDQALWTGHGPKNTPYNRLYSGLSVFTAFFFPGPELFQISSLRDNRWGKVSPGSNSLAVDTDGLAQYGASSIFLQIVGKLVNIVHLGETREHRSLHRQYDVTNTTRTVLEKVADV